VSRVITPTKTNSPRSRTGLPPRRRFQFVLGGALTLVAASVLGGIAGAATPSAATHATANDLIASVPTLAFPAITVGDISDTMTVTFTNNGVSSDTVTGINISGPASDDFIEPSPDNCATLAAGASCAVQLAFVPGALGARDATISPADGSANPPTVALTGTGTEGYYEVSARGNVFSHGDANGFGDASSIPLTKPIVGSATTGDDGGYWLVASDGGIFTYGDAPYLGSTGAIRLNKPIVGMSSTVDDGGYWLVASDGGIFTFGDAPYLGSTGSIRLNEPIVGMAPTPDDQGYWLVASDGGIFTFGDAPYLGSTGAIRLNKPIVGMAATPDGGGYWLVASDGGIFTFGDAAYLGSTGGSRLNKPIVGMAATPDGGGYWLMASDGGIFNFGDAPFDGSNAVGATSPFVSIVGDAPPTLQAILDTPAVRQLRAASVSHYRR
jgi:hypothetical protein